MRPSSHAATARRARAAILAACLLSLPAAARADAWSVAERMMPGGMMAVVKVDLARFRDAAKSEALVDLADWVGVEDQMRLLVDCELDPVARIDQAVVLTNYHNDGLLFASGRGLADDLIRCLEKEGLKATRTGDLVRLVENDRAKGAFAVYGDTVVAAPELSESMLTHTLPGRGVANDAILARALNRVDRKAPAFAVYAEPTDLEDLDLAALIGGPRRLVRRPAGLLRALGAPVANPFLLAQDGPAEESEGADWEAEIASDDDDSDDDDDDRAATARMRYASLELSGTSSLRLRILAVVTDPAAVTKGLGREGVQEMVQAAQGTMTVQIRDAQTVEVVVTLPRSALAGKLAD